MAGVKNPEKFVRLTFYSVRDPIHSFTSKAFSKINILKVLGKLDLHLIISSKVKWTDCTGKASFRADFGASLKVCTKAPRFHTREHLSRFAIGPDEDVPAIR